MVVIEIMTLIILLILTGTIKLNILKVNQLIQLTALGKVHLIMFF